MWLFNECGRYCVRIITSKMPELTQLERVKSMMRYLPANGTAGLASLAVSTPSREPSPPARITARVFISPPHEDRETGFSWILADDNPCHRCHPARSGGSCTADRARSPT